jgi:hypothetical protein
MRGRFYFIRTNLGCEVGDDEEADENDNDDGAASWVARTKGAKAI